MIGKRSMITGAATVLLALGITQANAGVVEVQQTESGTITTYSEELIPGNQKMAGSVWSDFEGSAMSPSNARWGGSYALSTEMVQLFYGGRALAAGNIYGGQRITEVCMWYQRAGHRLTNVTCSYAINRGGAWSPGVIATVGTRDSFIPNAPKTEFRYYYRGINPNIF